MPQLIELKFAEELMPKKYLQGELRDLKVQDFVVAPRDGSEDVGFVAGVEYVSREQLKLRQKNFDALIRTATEKEKEAYFVRKVQERKALALCKEKAITHKLPMKVSMARIDPKTGKHIFHFTSEQRVDFRALVKELSAVLRARIELWQIGVRDEAKAVDGLGVCGLQTCCSSWLPDFRPINIRMAKEQDINLPPSKLSGQCGRLLCCLSYEVDQYREVGKNLKPKGATVNVEGRDGIIIDRNIMLQTYNVMFLDGGRTSVSAESMTEIKVPAQMKKMGDIFQSAQATEEPKAEAPKPEPVKVEAPREEPEQNETGEKPKRRRSRRRNKGGANKGDRQQAPNQQKAEAQGNDKPARAEKNDAPKDGEKKSTRTGRKRNRGRRRGRGPSTDSSKE